jgi:hypothetical protein
MLSTFNKLPVIAQQVTTFVLPLTTSWLAPNLQVLDTERYLQPPESNLRKLLRPRTSTKLKKTFSRLMVPTTNMIVPNWSLKVLTNKPPS